MHVPPYHVKNKWKYILLGMFIGSILSYLILAWMHGQMYEKLLMEKVQLETDLAELDTKHEALLEDRATLEEIKQPTLQTLEVTWLNEQDFKMDRLIQHQLEKILKDELAEFIGTKLTTIAESEAFLIKLIENNTYTIDDISYEIEVRKLFLTETMHLHLWIKKVS